MPEGSPHHGGGLDILALARRGAIALGIAGTIAVVLRAVGHAQQQSESGGWYELDVHHDGPDSMRLQYPTEEHLARVQSSKNYQDE